MPGYEKSLFLTNQNVFLTQTLHKSPQICDGRAMSLRSGASSRREKREDGLDSDLPEHVPEEFFRRYTDTDSRPLTPTPTSKCLCLFELFMTLCLNIFQFIQSNRYEMF